MFRSSAANPYDEVVVKATDENLTAENWELIITLCDKVTDEKEAGARNVIAAVVKRLAHRNPNVQLYALALAESLTKNCGIELHREVSSKSFTQTLEKLITDRTTHEKVKRRALSLIALWASEFENNPSLGIMEECYTSLKARGFKFDLPDEVPPVKVDDDLRRKEEEELQRVLEMSVHDKGGRDQWSNYLAASNGAGGSGSGSSSALNAAQPSQHQPDHHRQRIDSESYQANQGSSSSMNNGHPPASSSAQIQTQPKTEPSSPTPRDVPVPATSPQDVLVTRVRALHKFQATEPGELAFEKGDIIKVVDRIYKDWWRGQLRGRTGIFPVNYVETLPDPTPAEIAKEGEQEAAIFSQAANIDKLLTMLRNLDPEKDNLADNEEIQELYRTSMSLRPKIVKLIDRYNQKKADLVSMNDTFIKAKTIFDRMMEESLSRHTTDFGRPYYGPPGGPVWNVAAYDQGPGYPGSQYRQPAYNSPFQQQPTPGPGAFPSNSSQPLQSPAPFHHPVSGVQGQPQVSIPGQDPNAYNGHQPVSPGHQHHQSHYGFPSQGPQNEPGINGYGQQNPYPNQPHQAAAPQVSPEPAEQPTVLDITQPQQSEPPYDYDPTREYPDPNATAWARYYAQGGTDLAGAVYFKSIPGIKEASPEVLSIEGQNSQRAVQQSEYPTPLDTTQVQQQQPTQPYTGSELHQPSNPSPSAQSAAPLGAHPQTSYPQPGVPTSPVNSYPSAQMNYPGQTSYQTSVDELQHRFSSHNLQT